MEYIMNNPTKGISASEARNRYGVENLGPMIRGIRNRLAEQGLDIVSERTPRGVLRYYLAESA
jgi:hypothetical protein